MGNAVGFLLSPLLIGTDYTKMPTLNLIVAITLTIPFVLCIIFVKERPDKPPNYSQVYFIKNFRNNFNNL